MKEGNTWRTGSKEARSGKERESGRGINFSGQHSVQFSSVQFSRSVVSDSLWPHESQHAKPPCPSPTPAVYSNPCLSRRWCHPTISSSVVPFSSCPQSVPASGCFPMVNITKRILLISCVSFEKKEKSWPKHSWSYSYCEAKQVFFRQKFIGDVII